MLTLQPMSESEFEAWLIHSRKNYALEKQKEGLSEEDALAESQKSFKRLLPEGTKTPNSHLYSLKLKGSDEPIGHLWWALQKQGSKDVPWIYDIELKPEHRGKGYGRKAMDLAQQDVKAKGFSRLGLHVFGHNEVAQKLYRSMDFQITNVVMYKDLV